MGAEVGMASYLSKNYYNGDKEAGIIKFAHGGTSLLANLSGENGAGGNWVSPSYAQYKGYDVTAADTARITSYADYGRISAYAIEPMKWACGTDILGFLDGNTLKPQGYALRAEIAAMLHVFMEMHG
jgi:hypothetical protein